MSQTAALLGLSVEFVVNGRTIKIAPRDFECEALFSKALEREAMDGITRHSDENGAVGPAEYAILLRNWQHDVATFQYDPGSESFLFQRALRTERGQKKMASIQIAKGTPTNLLAAEDVVEQIWGDPKLLQAFKAAQEQADLDPNRPRPVLKTA